MNRVIIILPLGRQARIKINFNLGSRGREFFLQKNAAESLGESWATCVDWVDRGEFGMCFEVGASLRFG